MRIDRRRLNHLDPLVVFDAAARHGSFALAAGELNVSASAVSQQVRNLEADLGVQLFERAHRSVQLTDRGKLFQNSVSLALTRLASAVDEVRQDTRGGELEIVTDTSIAAMWLLPRLHHFQQSHPQCALRLTTTDVQAQLLGSPFQLAIAHGRGNWVGHESRLLFQEEVFPVCSPRYLDSLGGGIGLDDLPELDLLDLEYEQWHWMNWAIWLTENGLALPKVRRKMKLNNYPLVIDAARNGSGMALGWRHLVDEDLASGRLVQPFKASLSTQYGYHLIWPFNDALSDMASAFLHWCIEAAGGKPLK